MIGDTREIVCVGDADERLRLRGAQRTVAANVDIEAAQSRRDENIERLAGRCERPRDFLGDLRRGL